MTAQNKTNNPEVIPLEESDDAVAFAVTFMVSIVIISLYYLFPPSIDMYQEKNDTMFINDFCVLYFCSTVIAYCLFLKIKIVEGRLLLINVVVMAIYIVGFFILTVIANSKFTEWHRNTKLLEQAVLNKDKEGAELFYSKLISTFDDPNLSKENICQTKEKLLTHILSLTADVLALNGNFKGALSCIDRASNDISEKTSLEKKRYASILNKLISQKYNLCLEFEDYIKAFSIDIKRYKKNYWVTENRIIRSGYFFVKQALQNKNAKDASGVLDLLLAEMDFAQTTTTANLCHSEENIFPELLVVAADIFSLKKQHAESARCLDKALYILRYVKTHNFVENLSPRKITVKEILEKKASTIY